MPYQFLPSISKDAGIKLIASSLIDFLQTKLQNSQVVNILMSGGNTPLAIYKELLESYPDFSWSKCRFIMLDERYVPFESDRNNAGQCYRNFICYVDVLDFIYPDTSLDINSCVSSFSKSILNIELLEVDIAILGTAADGHLASIFPNVVPSYRNGDAFSCHHLVEGIKEDRISLTLDFINKSKNIWMMAFGEDKKIITKKAKTLIGSSLPALNLNKAIDPKWFYDEVGE